ncbi:hypothetical protein PLICRDRAFT_29206 [Plicaturopsis crispa FD-325 SS-3]|nr:hypothetical protein PLICRDRAFT_29206 [Plicaturopsis crispa FD-325 SS-3]
MLSRAPALNRYLASLAAIRFPHQTVMATLSQVKLHNPGTLDVPALARRATELLKRTPYPWQLEMAKHVLAGVDVILDVGTGSGKSLCFDIPLLCSNEDISLIISPLTALMLEQAGASPLKSIAVCEETLRAEGKEALFKRIAEGDAQRILVSPEVAGSLEFSRKVLSQKRFQEHLRMVIIDEAHCVSLWGGSFRAEYSELGVLRGRLPPSVVFVVASATLPKHVLDDICIKLSITRSAATVSLSNARPNVALSVRKIVHPEDTKADLRFMIPDGATSAEDIPIQLAYFNRRTETEDACDQLQNWAESVGIPRSAIGFYHAKIGTLRKRELEVFLREGKIRILCCTDAVGMGCDMRNIFRVVLWKLPPSFCALAQRAGRAARDFSKLGEAILLVSAKVLKDGIAEAEAHAVMADLALPENQEGAVAEQDGLADAADDDDGVDVVAGQDVAVGEGGARLEHHGEGEDMDDDEGIAPTLTAAQKKKQKKKRKKKLAQVSASDDLEARTLSEFACTTACRRIVWDNYFVNASKRSSFLFAIQGCQQMLSR